MGISERKMCVPFAFSTNSRPFGLLVFIPVELSMKMEHEHPMEISIQGFDASHLLPLLTNQFFQLNGKQPVNIMLVTLFCVI